MALLQVALLWNEWTGEVNLFLIVELLELLSIQRICLELELLEDLDVLYLNAFLFRIG